MSKIGDLFVRLGLKKDDYSRGLKEAGRESESFVSTLRGIGTKAAAIWAAIGVGAVALADKFAHTSQRFGDIWDQTTAGMKEAWSTFLAALTSFDFERFGTRIKNSFQAAKEAAAAHDAEFEVQNSLRIRKAAIEEELSLLELQMRNEGLSREKRLEAQRRYLDMVKPLYDAELQLRQRIMQADSGVLLAGAGLNNNKNTQAMLRYAMTNILPDETLTSALDKWARGGNKNAYRFSQEERDALNNFANQNRLDASNLKAYAKIIQEYQSRSDQYGQLLTDAFAGFDEASSAFVKENRRIMQLGDLLNARELKVESKDDHPVLADIDKAMEKDNRIVEERIRGARQQILKELENDMAADYAEFESKLASDMDLLTQQALAPLKEANENALALGEEFHSAIIDGYVDGIQELMDQLAGLSDANPGAIFQALLTPLADMAVKEGKILVASGLGIEAIKTALESLNGVAAIAAGSALIMIGSAAKSGLAALAQGGSAGGYATYGAQGGGTMGTGGASTIATEMTINVTGRLDGRDIVLSGQRTLNQWGR